MEGTLEMNKKLLTALLVFRGDWCAGMMAQSMEQKQKLPWKGYNAYTQPARENDIEIHIYTSVVITMLKSTLIDQ